jgi:adenylate cyclase
MQSSVMSVARGRAPWPGIAQDLRANPADSFPDATVLIADVVGFGNLTAAVLPDRLALMLEEIFTLFDGFAGDRGLKKIKTLGNSYMAASGVPVPSVDHAVRAAHMALDMIEALEGFNERTGSSLQARIGIATGGVVAGVIGRLEGAGELQTWFLAGRGGAEQTPRAAPKAGLLARSR